MFYEEGTLVGLADDAGTNYEGDVYQVWKVKATSYILRAVYTTGGGRTVYGRGLEFFEDDVVDARLEVEL